MLTPTDGDKPATVSSDRSSTNGRLYFLAVLFLPLIVLWYRDSPLYSPLWYGDAWFYLGFFKNLVEFKRDLFYNFYYGSRLGCVLPGFLAHVLFSPVVANFVLHMTTFYAATLSFFYALRMLAGARTAFLATMIFSVCPWLWCATGWDYPDGVGIAYCLMAIAFLTKSATDPALRRSILAAGMAMAGMAYSHLFLISFLPLLAIYYVGLNRIRWRAPVMQSLVLFCAWAGAGIAIVTFVLCGLNYLLDGIFWFYAPSVAQARDMAQNFMYFQSIWENGQLRPWLWPAIAGACTALLPIPSRLRKFENGDAYRTLLSAILLLAIGWMLWLQSRGNTVLGHHPYASYLLPFVFLVLGSSYFRAVERMNSRAFTMICFAAAAIFGILWFKAYQVHLPAGALRALTGVSASTLLAALLWRKRAAGTILALFGFASFTAVTLDQTFHLNLHGNRQQYKRIMDNHQRIEAARRGRSIRFWFDQDDSGFHEYYAMNALYLSEFSRVGNIFGDPEVKPAFPHGCNSPVDPGTMIVVTSQKEHAEELARAALTDCWRPFGMYPVTESVETVKTEGPPYTLALLRADVEQGQWHPLQTTFDLKGMGTLLPVTDGRAPKPLPLERWLSTTSSSDPPGVQMTPSGMQVRTPSGPYALACRYGPLIAQSSGRYRFALQYTNQHNWISFTAHNSDQTAMVGVDRIGHRFGGHKEMSFWVKLKAGDGVFLRIANNGMGAASLLVKQLTVTEVAETPDK